MKLSKIILLFSNFILLADQQPEIGNNTVAQTLLNWRSSLDDESSKLLSSWVGPDPCKSWVGIGCNKNNITITSISLENFNLQGNLDLFDFSTLSSLESLNLGNNQLTGPIRSEIRYLRRLKDLNFSSNQLTGRIPLELGELRSLENLDLGSNDLDGQIPISLGHLAHLYFLDLQENKLSGPIPSSFENFTNIEYLYLQKNQLTGPILRTSETREHSSIFAFMTTF
ncbi:putative non-specific serine/threonine protein kinase [Helianthus annuus]|nr:putative non-specific serine/threonine protein kinase [Helianthus annuus]